MGLAEQKFIVVCDLDAKIYEWYQDAGSGKYFCIFLIFDKFIIFINVRNFEHSRLWAIHDNFTQSFFLLGRIQNFE